MERKQIKRGLNRLMLMPILLSIVYATVLVWQLDRMLSSGAWVEHTSFVLARSSETERHIQAQESALRGYLLSPQPIFLTQFHGEEQTVDTLFQELHVLVVDNPPQVRRLDSIMQKYWVWESSALQWLQVASPQPAGIDTSTARDSAVLFQTTATQAIRTQFGDFTTRETLLYSSRTQEFRTGTIFLIVLIAVASILIGLILGLNARRQTRRFIERFSHAVDESERSRELLETTLLSIDDAIIVTDTLGQITLVNRRAESLTGWLEQTAIGHPVEQVFQILNEMDRAPVTSPVEAVLRDNKPFQPKALLCLQSKLRVEYSIELSIIPVHGTGNVLAGAVIVFRDITELRENQKQAELREQEFRALLENTPDVILRYGNDLTIVYANPAVEQLLGVLPQTLMGRHFEDIGIEEENYTPWEDAVREVFRTGRSATTEMEYQTLRGLRRYHVRLVPEVTREPGKDETRIHSVISIARDVTELKQSEERLRESEQRFRSIVENSPDSFFLLRAIREAPNAGGRRIIDFVIDYVNGRAADLLTLNTSELPGKKISEILPSENPQETIEKHARILESGVAAHEEYEVESPYLRKARWLHTQYVPLNGDRIAVTTSDITSRMQTLLALEHSEERYRRLVEHASEAIFSTDREGRFTYANPYIRELGNYDNSDISQFYFTDVLPKDHRDRVKRHFFRQFLSGSPYSSIEVPFEGKDGKLVWLAIKSTLQMKDGQVVGFDCIATDITERKRIELELREVRNRVGMAS